MAWKSPPLPSNEQGSLRRLTGLSKKLERHGLTAEYDQIIREQKQQRIIEDCPFEPTGTEFYIPHKPVIREEAASTKLRLVYGASARAHACAPSERMFILRPSATKQVIGHLGSTTVSPSGDIRRHPESLLADTNQGE